MLRAGPLIMAKGAAQGTNDSGDTALHEAAHAGHMVAVTLLLEYNADPTVLNQVCPTLPLPLSGCQTNVTQT